MVAVCVLVPSSVSWRGSRSKYEPVDVEYIEHGLEGTLTSAERDRVRAERRQRSETAELENRCILVVGMGDGRGRTCEFRSVRVGAKSGRSEVNCSKMS